MRQYLVDHDLNYGQAHIVHLTGEVTEMEVDAPRRQFLTPVQIAATLQVIRHARNQWQLDHTDVLALRAGIMAQHEQEGAAAPDNAAGVEAPRPKDATPGGGVARESGGTL